MNQYAARLPVLNTGMNNDSTKLLSRSVLLSGDKYGSAVSSQARLTSSFYYSSKLSRIRNIAHRRSMALDLKSNLCRLKLQMFHIGDAQPDWHGPAVLGLINWNIKFLDNDLSTTDLVPSLPYPTLRCLASNKMVIQSAQPEGAGNLTLTLSR